MEPVDAALESAREALQHWEACRGDRGAVMARRAVAAFIASLDDYNRNHMPHVRLDLDRVSTALRASAGS